MGNTLSQRSKDHGKTWVASGRYRPADGPDASWVIPLVTPAVESTSFTTTTATAWKTLRGKRGPRGHARLVRLSLFRRPRPVLVSRAVTACRERPHRLRSRQRLEMATSDLLGICKPQMINRGCLISPSPSSASTCWTRGGWLYRSDNLLTERDPAKLRWNLWPEGDHGIRSPEFGSVQEEHKTSCRSRVTGSTAFIAR